MFEQVEPSCLARRDNMPFYRHKGTVYNPWFMEYLYYIFGQSMRWKAHEQLALEGSHARRGTLTCLLCYGHHVVTQLRGHANLCPHIDARP
jgi:hypothetical protein